MFGKIGGFNKGVAKPTQIQAATVQSKEADRTEVEEEEEESDDEESQTEKEKEQTPGENELELTPNQEAMAKQGPDTDQSIVNLKRPQEGVTVSENVQSKEDCQCITSDSEQKATDKTEKMASNLSPNGNSSCENTETVASITESKSDSVLPKSKDNVSEVSLSKSKKKRHRERQREIKEVW